MENYSAKEEYKINEDFRDYIEKYARANKVEPEKAIEHMIVYVNGQSYYNKRKGIV